MQPNAQQGDQAAADVKIAAAERWRVAGERLRMANPELFDRVFEMIVCATIGISDETEQEITETSLDT